MRILYTPSGRAREYGELACNLYTTCPHGCRYCYSPMVLHKQRDEFCVDGPLRNGALHDLEKDAQDMRAAADSRRVHFCFLCDPYPPSDAETETMRKALEILAINSIPAQVLTKGGMRASRDFELMAEFDTWFGQTIVFAYDNRRSTWEPNAASLSDRIEALKHAYKLGIHTWLSIEPIILSSQAVMLIEDLSDWVCEWRVGRWNYSREANGIHWDVVAQQVYEALQASGCSYRIKQDLAEYLPESACSAYTAPEAE